jgi:hypothetical protein
LTKHSFLLSQGRDVKFYQTIAILVNTLKIDTAEESLFYSFCLEHIESGLLNKSDDEFIDNMPNNIDILGICFLPEFQELLFINEVYW